nr:unnamed protein product [Spirometra erinaceieuropaei]
MDALRRILGQLLLRPTSRTSFSNVQQTLPYIPYSRFAYMYEIHQDLEQTHPIPSLRNIPSSAFFRIHQGVNNYVKHTFNVVHFAPVNHLSISKDPQYEKVTRFSSITPAIKGRDLVKEQIGELGMSGGEFYAVRRSPSSQISTESNCLDEVSTTDAETSETHTASVYTNEARFLPPSTEELPTRSVIHMLFSEGIVRRELEALNESKSPGPDEIPSKLLKKLANAFVDAHSNVI